MVTQILIDSGDPDLIGFSLLMANPSSDPEAAAALQAGQVVKGVEDAELTEQINQTRAVLGQLSAGQPVVFCP